MALPALFLTWYVSPLASLCAIFLSPRFTTQGIRMQRPGGAVLVIQRFLRGAVPKRCLRDSHRHAAIHQPRVFRPCRRCIAWTCLLCHEDGQRPCYAVNALGSMRLAGELYRGSGHAVRTGCALRSRSYRELRMYPAGEGDPMNN